MTTATWNTRVKQTDDITFREWGSEFAAKLAAVGLTQAADTGQINWTTVARPGTTNTYAGYEIWYLTGSLHATSPIYLKIEYGCGTALDRPFMRISVGNSTNGAGTLTGAFTVGRNPMASSAATTDVLYPSYMCYANGCFWFHWKVGHLANAGFFISRSCDSTGAPTGDACVIRWSTGGQTTITGSQHMKLSSTAVAYTFMSALAAGGELCWAPGVEASGMIGADYQIAVAWTMSPRPSAIINAGGIIFADVVSGTTFSATIFGSTAHTYFIAYNTFGPANAVSLAGAGSLIPCLIWE